MLKEFKIPSFGPVTSLKDTTEIGNALQTAANVLLRPVGAIRGIPKFSRLWAIGNAATIAATVRTLTKPGGGTLATADKTAAIRISRQGKNFLLFYNLTADKCRGLFYMGDDGTFTSGSYDFTAGAPTYTVLASGLHDTARWYGQAFYGQLMLQNGEDSPVCVQLARTAKSPGVWRVAGSNARPAAPVVSVAPPGKTTNISAFYTIPATGTGSRTGGVALTFTVNPENFVGSDGNSRVYVTIAHDPYAAVITSSLIGDGTTANPYQYTINTGPGASASSNDAIVAFVNADTKILTILSASTATPNATADTQSWASTVLTGGTGTGTSDGFSNRTVSVYARYFDTGVNKLGYEGISSVKSNEIIITASQSQDIVVNVDLNPTVESGRFDSIRLYLQFGEDVDAKWFLVDPANPINNSVAKTFTVTSTGSLVDVLTMTSVDTAANSIRINGHGFKLGEIVRVTGASLPAPLLANTNYYVRDVTTNTFKLSLTSGGSAINLTTAGTGLRQIGRWVHVFTSTAHGFTNGDRVRLTTTGTLPPPMTLATNYFVVRATTNTFALSATASGWPLLLTGAGSGIQTSTIQTKTVVIGSNTPFGQELYVDQNRPLEHTHIVNCNGQIWRGGVKNFEERLYPSKPATEDELAPEGANADAYEIAQGINSAGAGRITALYSDGYRLHVHAADGIRLIDPANPDNQQIPPLITGAINSTALVPWTGSSLYYLGADLSLYEFNGARYGKRDANLATAGVAAYLRQRVDLAEVGRQPQRISMLADLPSQFIWYWLPGTGGALQGYCYDFTQGGITGPFDAPAAYAAARMEQERPEIIFADESGNLFVWDTANQNDYGDTLPSQSAFTAYSTPDTPPVSQAGYPTAVYGAGSYRQAVWSVFETGYFDLGTPAQKKHFAGVVFTSVKNSRGVVIITVTGKNTGLIVSRTYGDMGALQTVLQSHKLLFNRTDTAVKLKFEVLGAEQKAWTIRDVTLLYRPAGPV